MCTSSIQYSREKEHSVSITVEAPPPSIDTPPGTPPTLVLSASSDEAIAVGAGSGVKLTRIEEEAEENG